MVYEFVHNRPNNVVFCDNYFTTHSLFVELLSVNVTIVGTSKWNNALREVKDKAESELSLSNDEYTRTKRPVCLFV